MLGPRAVLSAPTTAEDERILSIVILIVSVFSVVGAAWVIASFTFISQLRFFRHQLILGLAISDLFMGLNFLMSTAMNLSGRAIGAPSRQGFCSLNGFMTQLFVVQTDYWVLIIAVNTFLILGDKKRAASWVQDHSLLLWLLPWGLSALWAALGLGLIGYGDIGAWCWFTSDVTRLLVNFIPRWIIIIALLGIYVRLYFVIYKAHKGTVSDEEISVIMNVMPLGTLTPDQKPPKGDAGSHSGVTISSSDVSPQQKGIKIRGDNKGLKAVSYRMMQYPLVYMFIWIIPTALRIYHATAGKQGPFSLTIIDKACIVVQGFVDAMVYGFNERAWNGWRDHFSGSSRRFPIR